MIDLKTVLFEETFYHFNNWIALKNELGEWDRLVNIQYAKFVACYTVIENSRLVNEYQKWRDEKQNENKNHK